MDSLFQPRYYPRSAISLPASVIRNHAMTSSIRLAIVILCRTASLDKCLVGASCATGYLNMCGIWPDYACSQSTAYGFPITTPAQLTMLPALPSRMSMASKVPLTDIWLCPSILAKKFLAAILEPSHMTPTPSGTCSPGSLFGTGAPVNGMDRLVRNVITLTYGWQQLMAHETSRQGPP